MRRALPLALSAGLSTLSCGASIGEAQAPPAAFVVNFPSVAAAVATDSLEVQLFPLTEPELCQSLLEKRASGQTLPPRDAEIRSVTPCELAAGASKARIELANGSRAALVTATREGELFLVGCGVLVLERDLTPRAVSLTLASPTVSVPPTTCTQLSQRCDGRC